MVLRCSGSFFSIDYIQFLNKRSGEEFVNTGINVNAYVYVDMGVCNRGKERKKEKRTEDDGGKENCCIFIFFYYYLFILQLSDV